jgi:RNA polymerase sigma-70 factor (ECF subfamily)
VSDLVGPEPPDPDWATLRRVAAGDGAAFALLVERHQERVVAVCGRLLGDREAALDAAQEVFLKTWRAAGRLEPRGRLFTWIYRVAVNHCLNRLRRRRLATFLSLSEPSQGGDADRGDRPALDPPAPDPDPEARLVSAERWRATRRAIGRLPAGQRVVLMLAKLERLSQREIAEALGITEGAVESRLVRAMRRLAAAQETPEPRVSNGGAKP